MSDSQDPKVIATDPATLRGKRILDENEPFVWITEQEINDLLGQVSMSSEQWVEYRLQFSFNNVEIWPAATLVPGAGTTATIFLNWASKEVAEDAVVPVTALLGEFKQRIQESKHITATVILLNNQQENRGYLLAA